MMEALGDLCRCSICQGTWIVDQEWSGGAKRGEEAKGKRERKKEKERKKQNKSESRGHKKTKEKEIETKETEHSQMNQS